MPHKVNMGVLVPTHFSGEIPAPSQFTEWFRAAEELGFDTIWVLDRIFGAPKVPDALMMLAWASNVTSRVRLGTAVLLLPYRHPILLAKEVATLDYISGGRLDFGIGLGGREVEFTAFGMQMTERVGRFREVLAIMRKLWTEPNVSFQGRYHSFESVNLEPRPVQGGDVPIWVGGEADGVLKRTAELADGWIGGSRNNPQQFKEKRQKIRDFAEARGRDPDSLGFGSLEYITVDENRDRALEQTRLLTSAVYGPQFDADSFATFGPPDVCRARLQELINAGATHPIVCPPNLDIEQITRAAEEVVPRLKR